MTVDSAKIRLSLGPVPYYWRREALLAFYDRIADTPVDIVYLGETICSKRRALRNEDWVIVAQRLRSAGKEVLFSTLTLIESGSEMGVMKKLCSNGEYTVEANDIGAVELLSGKHPFVTGPAINIYNARTLQRLADQGLRRWVMPVELSRAALVDLQRQRPKGVETEVIVFGRLPLAYSARCFTARARNLPRDDCRSSCIDYPDGLLLSTREQEPFLVLNGIQTQSARSCNLIGELADMVSLGVDVLRINPLHRHTEAVIRLFHDHLHGYDTSGDAEAILQELVPIGSCNGYWHGAAGMNTRTSPE